MNLKRFFRSFKDAFRGILYVFENEQNFRIQIFISVLVLFFSKFFHISRSEWLLIIFLICFVLILELINSAVEKFSDLLKPRMNYQIEIVKDIMAGVVFLASIMSTSIGLIIFFPHIVDLLR